MNDWLPALAATLANGNPAVLLSVAHTVGSAPREAGATMLITAEYEAGSIGGGQLEWLAASAAHSLLGVDGPPRLLRFALGPSLGQCCGGIVWLIAERIEARHAADWQARADAVADGQALARRLASDDLASRWQLLDPPPVDDGTRLQVSGNRWTFTHTVGADDFPVYVFGAGHTGSAIVRALAPLGARISWVDGREYLFPNEVPDNVERIVTDTPTAEVRDAPPGSYFLVMTHSHTLDFEICAAIFARQDFAWFGLIGSTSKRNSFSRQLTARGLPPERLDDLTCPIGVAGIQSKQPAAIAASVAAQLLQVRETRAAIRQASHPGPDAPPLSSLPRPQ